MRCSMMITCFFRRNFTVSKRLTERNVEVVPQSVVLPKPAMAETTIEEHLSTDNLFSGNQKAAEESARKVMTKEIEHEAGLKARTAPDVVPFDDVPGPKVFKWLNKLWSYLPVVGTQLTVSFLHQAHVYMGLAGKQVKWAQRVRPFNYLFDEYGPLVRVGGVLGGDLVMVRRPEDVRSLLDLTGPPSHPKSSVLDSLEAYRKSRAPIQIPIKAANDWSQLPEKLQDKLTFKAVEFFAIQEQISDELVTKLYSGRSIQEEVSEEFKTNLYKWGLECMSRTVFDKEIGFMEVAGEGTLLTEAGRMLAAIVNASDGLSKCETGLQMWRVLPTPSWNKLVNSCDILEGLLCRNIRMAYMRLDKMAAAGTGDVPGPTMLEAMILKEKVPPEELLTKLLDIFLLGVNTAVNSAGFMLYHLAKSSRAQNKLFKEILDVMPKTDSKLSSDELPKLKYLNSCLLESLRLKTPFPFTTKVVNEDIELRGYKVPKGTTVLMAHEVACMNEDRFEEPDRFLPERWHLERPVEPEEDPLGPVPIPGGLTRDLITQQISLLVVKLLRHFSVEYHYGTIRTDGRFLAIPNKPFKFRLTERAQ